MFSHHEAGIPTIRQLKIIEEVKKLVDEMKNLCICNLNRTSSRKASKTIENFKENSLSPNCSISCECCGGSSLSLSYHSSRFSITPHHFAWIKFQTFHPRSQGNIDSSTVVMGRLTVFSPFALANKACLEVFSDAFCLHGQTI